MVIEIIGWLGALAVLGAYIFVSTGQLSGKSKKFQLLNLIGAVCIIINSWFHRAVPSVGLNLVWGSIALYEIAKIFNKKKRRS